MATLFIANPTLQHRELTIRMNKVHTRIVSIPALGQEQFPDELEGEQLKMVIKQLENAGGIAREDAPAIHKRFSLLYSVGQRDDAMTTDDIDQGVEADQEARQQLSSEVLERSGVAAFNKAANVGGREMTMEIVQVDDKANVPGGVNVEIIVSDKRGVRDGERVSTKRN